MRNNILLAYVSLLLITSCVSNRYSGVFNYDIKISRVDHRARMLYGEKIEFSSDHPSIFDDYILFDSILLSYQLNDATKYYYQAFDLNSRKSLGSFCYKGRARDEFIGIAPFEQLVVEGGELKAYIYDGLDQTRKIWNISRSMESGKTAIDDVISNHGSKFPNAYMFYLSNNDCLSHSNIYYDKFSTNNPIPSYQLRSVDNYKDIHHEYVLYNKLIIDGEHPSLYLRTEDCIKPDDHSKIVMAMRYHPHIAILDVKSGDIKGVGVDEGYEFNTNDFRRCFRSVDVNANYIYALYRNEKVMPYEFDPQAQSILYQFDWDGNIVNRYIFAEEPIMTIAIDRGCIDSGVIYGSTLSAEFIYRYNLFGIFPVNREYIKKL